MSGYPLIRMRRRRATPGIRRLLQETRLHAADFIYPLFVRDGRGVREPIDSMPGQYRYSSDTIVKECERAHKLGVSAVLLFGIPSSKDALGKSGYDPNGVIPRAVRSIKKALPDIVVITDVCLCEYTDHGHCGVLEKRGATVRVDNDRTLPLLAKMSLAHADAGADVVAPSDMMDGRVGAIRAELDRRGYARVPILSYAAKYASGFYGPFRDAAGSAPKFGDRAGYQMNPPNVREALAEIALDMEEGADIVMVKPALAYLDVIHAARARFDVPIAAYNVSGEYSMVKAAAQKGWLDERRVAMEILTAIRRAGADLILTYWAPDACEWIRRS
ncbi:MAG: delta-aminolevulinic acid dehydratase [Candidatus Lindowbacteria bacterium RIFCSPLOWO2_12_FULL_62_27]|nr:MAG: delta-aminolevulinic acid dehydratase [Candidatus Lindowbacteria bacterium RIFCSPLOWO2_12_FULL_62_27]